LRKNGLVVGARGVIGRNLVEHLSTLEDWDVVGLSRQALDFESRAQFISINLLDRQDCEDKLLGLDHITHIFYAAFQERPTLGEHVAPNLNMLRNVVEVIDPIAPNLERIVLMQGGKAYGVHLGPFKTPAKESDPRHMPPNFYYDQEDFLRARQVNKSWTWTALRPDVVCGFAVGNPMNLMMVIAVYAAISKELGLPLRFPGKPSAYQALTQVTDANVLAKASVWAGTEPACGNEIFNVTNGDLFRWEHVWPNFAEFFDMPYAPLQAISLIEFMADKGSVWNAIVKKHGLVPHRYESIAAWEFGDFIFGCDYDIVSDTSKVRRFGFHELTVDSEEMFLRLFQLLRQNKIIA